MKPENVKIIEISTSYEPKKLSTAIYGLGDDGIPYTWNSNENCWELY